MAMCRSVLYVEAPGKTSAAQVLNRVTRHIYPDIKEDMFISMAYLLLDENGNDITLCRAGHDAPLMYEAKTREVRKLNPPGMALGIDSGDVFERVTRDFTLQMAPDDCLILYTDGIIEGRVAAGHKRLGEKGLHELIAEHIAQHPDWRARPAALLDELVASAERLNGSALNDDIAMVLVGAPTVCAEVR